MPRNGSGTYSLPSGNPVSAGTLIDATWANNTLNDLANEMTDSLSRSGEGGMLAPFRLSDGVQATPGLAWSNEPSTGFYRAGTNEMWAVVGGTQIQQFTATGSMVRFAAGAVGTPSVTVHGDTNTGIYFPAADKVAVTTGGVQRLIVDDSGNLGLGVTPSAWWVNDKAAQVLGGAVWAFNGDTANVNLSANVYQDSSNVSTYIGTGTATRYAQETGAHKWFNAASGTAGNAITFTQAMTLDASSNLIVGGTTAQGASAGRGNVTVNGSSQSILSFSNGGSLAGYVLHDGTDLWINNTGAGAQRFYTNGSERARITSGGNFGIGTSTPGYKFVVEAASSVGGSVDAALFYNSAGSTAKVGIVFATGANNLTQAIRAITTNTNVGDLAFETNGGSGLVERARITGGGVLLVGATSNFGAADDRLQVDTATASARSGIFRNNTSATDTVGVWNSATTGDNLFIQFYTEAGASVRGNITYNRGAGQVAYNVTSDVRLKDNIADAVDAGSKVDALQVRQFDWKETGNHVDYGFVAQELDAVVPNAVSKPEDAQAMWSVDYSKLVPMLVKEIQSLRARVAALEAE